jgi:hypothetical protein|tara:strand:- start:48 stop:518 length:471 start_codon:yes stop_codon:yes gene_type:complete
MDFPKIISGGQTGADRAALDWAIDNGIPHGGWCPAGRLAEDGVIDSKYNLRETSKADYLQRTEWNVRDSDATVIFSIKADLMGGSLATQKLADKHLKASLHLTSLQSPAENATQLRGFIRKHEIKVLNIAGPRASGEPELRPLVQTVLDELFEIWG